MVISPPNQRFILGCDLGSTSFRLPSVEFGSRRVLDEVRDAKGVRTFTALVPIERAAAMARFLGEHLMRRPGLPADVPLIVSGMATATVGWVELPYAHPPFRLDGSDCRVARAEFSDPQGRNRHAVLVSGVRTADDNRRGEECILAGVHALQPAPKGRTLALPAGTHPKHALLLVSDDLRVTLYQEALRELGLASGKAPRPSVSLTAVVTGQEAILRRNFDLHVIRENGPRFRPASSGLG